MLNRFSGGFSSLALLPFVTLALLGVAATHASAGDAEAKQAGSRLVITGDAEINGYTLTQKGPTLTLTPDGAHTVNGAAESLDFEGATSLRIADTSLSVTLDGVGFPKGVKAKIGGDGAVSVANGSVIGKSLTLRIEGEGQLTISGAQIDGKVSATMLGDASVTTVGMESQITKDLSVKAKNGQHDLGVTNSTLLEDVSLKARNGDQELLVMSGAEVGGDVSLKTRDGLHALRVSTLVHGKVVMKARNGDDTLELLGAATIEQDVRASLGGGENLVRVVELSDIFGSLIVRARGSCDTVTFNDAEVQRDVRIALRSEEVSVGLDHSLIDGRILYRGGSAEDHITLLGSSIGKGAGTSVFSLGGGDDVLSAQSDFDGNVRVTGGRGWGQVDFGGSTVSGKFSAKLGNDDDCLDGPED